MTFKEYILEAKISQDWDALYLEDAEKFNAFLELLSDYMDLSEKKVIKDLYNLVKGTRYLSTLPSVYRVQCTDSEEIDFGTREMISSSTAKITGKTLQNVINDMKDRYEYHKNMKTCDVKYIQILKPEGINIHSLIQHSLKKGTTLNKELDDYYLDLFKRLKSEKEFLAVNKGLKIGKIQEVT
jgi:hypothetical protein